MSKFLSAEKYPMDPAYIFLLHFSSSSIISIARIFGAPVTVPAGKPANIVSKIEFLLSKLPSTLETMCITCEYFSILNFSVTFTVLIFETLPTSFLPKSKSIRCSDNSLLSFKSCFLKNLSFFAFDPRGLVPAIGRMVILLFLSLTNISGLLPII